MMKEKSLFSPSAEISSEEQRIIWVILVFMMKSSSFRVWWYSKVEFSPLNSTWQMMIMDSDSGDTLLECQPDPSQPLTTR